MSDTALDQHALTAVDIKALRGADSLCFFHQRNGVTDVNLTKKHDPNDGFGTRELHTRVPLAPAQVTDYGQTRHGAPIATANWVFTSPKFTPELQTAFRLLKAGDVLRPCWTAANNNPNVTDAHLVNDEFRLLIQRPMKDGRFHVMTFLIDTSVTTEFNLMRNVSWT